MRRALKIPVALLLLFLAAIVLTIFLATQTTLPNRGAKILLTKYVESKYNLDISFSDIRGSFLRDLTIYDIRVDFEVAPSRYRLVKIKKLNAYYDLRKIIRGELHFDSVILVEPTVVLRTDRQGNLLIPQFGGDGNGERSTSEISLGQLQLINGRFQWFKIPTVVYLDKINIVASAEISNGIIKATVDSLSLACPQKDFVLQHLRMNLVLSEGTIGLDSLQLQTGASHIQGGGVFPLDSSQPFMFRFVGSHISLDELSTLAGVKLLGEVDFDAEIRGDFTRFGGEANLDGTFYHRRLGPLTTRYSYSDGILRFEDLNGKAFDGTLSGLAEIDLLSRPEVFTADLNVSGINLDKIIPNTFPSAINGKLQISGCGFGPGSFALDLQVNAGTGSFDFVNYDSLYGLISLNVNDIYFHPGFFLNYKNSRFMAEGVVDYDGGMFLTGNFQTSQLADFWGDLFIKELSGGGYGSYVVSGPTLDPDIKGELRGDSCSFYGLSTDSLIAQFDIESFLYSRRGSTRVRTWQSDVWSIPADSVFTSVDIDSDLVEITEVVLFDERIRLEASGNAIIYDSTASVKVDQLLFEFDSLTYTNDQPVDIQFLIDRIVVEQLNLSGEEGAIEIQCAYGYDSTIILAAILDSFPFAPWLTTLNVDTTLTGYLDLTLEMKGRLNDPEIKVNGSVNDLSYNEIHLGTLTGEIDYADSSLYAHDLQFVNDGGRSTLSGSFPLIIDLDSAIVSVPEEEIDLKLISTGTDLSLAIFTVEDLESLTGQYVCTLQVYGTPRQPQSKGFFEMKEGRAKLYQVENPLENIEAEIYSQGKFVNIEWIEATTNYKGENGVVRAAGDIIIESKDIFDYDISLVGFNMPVKYDLGDIYVRCDTMELEITGSDPPQVQGWVTVSKVDYYDEFEEEELLVALEAADTSALWEYEIAVDLTPTSVNVKNSDVNAVLDGELRVIRKNAKDNYLGMLNIVRGNYYLFDMSFKIEPGSRIIFDDIEQPNPTLDIKVSTRIRHYTAEASSRSYDKLELTITGTLLQPSIRAAESSAYTDADIVSLLTINRSVSGSDDAYSEATPLEGRLQVGAAGYLANLTSQALTRKLGVEMIEIIPTYNEKNIPEGAIISLGFYTTSNLYIYFSSALSLEQATEGGFEYHIGRHFYIDGRRDRDDMYHLNLNLNWEFR